MPTITGTFAVTEGTNVRLSVVSGEGQLGHSTVFLGPKKVCSRQEVVDVDLGDGATLRGQVLVISTLVVDLNTQHDRTSVTVALREPPKAFTQSEDATSTGTVSYLAVITFE